MMMPKRPRADDRTPDQRQGCTSGKDRKYVLEVWPDGNCRRVVPYTGPETRYRVAALGQPLPEADQDMSDPVYLCALPGYDPDEYTPEHLRG